MKKYISLLLSLFLAICAWPQAPITMGTLLKEMTDPDAVARFPFPAYTARQASSYDRRSVAPDKPGWFANADFNQFIRQEKKGDRSEFVMMDADGPGAIVRFWLTTQVKPGVLRFYFDNETEASLRIPAFDLMQAGFQLGSALLNPHSSYEPAGKGGNTLYLPLLYQRHCKVTWQFADSANMKTSHYYQINYRSYTPGTIVETFRMSQLVQYRSLIDLTDSLLWHPPLASGQEVVRNLTLSPGSVLTVPMPRAGTAIRQLRMSLSAVSKDDREKMWRSVIIRILFDGQETVNCPLGDFIGSGYGGQKISSWYRDLSDSGDLVSRWVMPYRRSATIVIENRNHFAVGFRMKAVLAPFKWDDRSMYFHTTHKFEKNVRDVLWDYDVTRVAKNDTAGPIDWNFIRVQGRGVYMGNTLAVDNHMNSWYGEGDARAWVDNESFPSEFGTGLEDYYNTSWAPVILYQTPFANAPRADKPSSFGQNTFTRTRILDAIPFQQTFSFEMEMLAWETGTIDAAATTYWYALPGARLP